MPKLAIGAKICKVSREEIPFSQKDLMEVCVGNDLKKVKEELEKVVCRVCRDIRELSGKEKVDQRTRMCRLAREYVENHYSDVNLNVNDMAQMLKVQPAYLSKLFKDVEGENLSQYISRIRLEHVKELLLSETRLEDVAAQCGYGSFRTFLRIFKQYVGLTPTQYRELEEKGKKGDER